MPSQMQPARIAGDPERLNEPRRSEPVTVFDIVFPEHANHYGTMFGGHAFAMMDKAAFLAANSFARSQVVTASSESVDFTVPVTVGMILKSVAHVVHASRTSMVVKVTLTCREMQSTSERKATTGYFTMVAVDADGKPIPIPPLVVEDQAAWKHAEQIRAAARSRRTASNV